MKSTRTPLSTFRGPPLPSTLPRWLNSTRPYAVLHAHVLQHYATYAGQVAIGPGYRTRRPRPHLTQPQWSLTRGKKTKSTLHLDDLPQGIIENDDPPVPEEPPEPALPTVILQARRNMLKFDNCVLLTRVGGFYELYLHQAEEYGPLLNLKVASKKTAAGPVPMAGFPFFQLDRFLKVLVQDLDKYVAIAEEFRNDVGDKVKSGGLMHDRKVARIVTPGTLIDEGFMNPYASNYILAAHLGGQTDGEGSGETGSDNAAVPQASEGESVGLAWLDLSTGQFFTQSTTLPSLSSVLTRIAPREIVLDEAFRLNIRHDISDVLTEDRHVLSYASKPEGIPDMLTWTPMLEAQVPQDMIDTFTSDEVSAGTLLLSYVKDRLQNINMKLQPPRRHTSLDLMMIDKNGMRSLEIKSTIRDGTFRGSLLHAIRRTVTKSGARLLNEWLSAPSTSLDVINSRQDLVACFIEDENLRESITLLLSRSHDAQRLVQKFALGRGDPDDLLDLASTVRATQEIHGLLASPHSTANNSTSVAALGQMAECIELAGPLILAQRIEEAIDEEGIVQQHQIEDSKAGEMMALTQDVIESEGTAQDASVLPKSAAKRRKPPTLRELYGEDNEVWIMKPHASPGLEHLHNQLQALATEREELTQSLRDRLDAQSLTLKWAPGLGHICHVRGKRDMKNVTDISALTSRQTTKSFPHQEWTDLGRRLDASRSLIRHEEQRVLQDLRHQVILNIVKLRRNAAVLDELDITTSFARLATEHNLVRPTLDNSTSTTIIGGRHPTVEGGLQEAGRTFISNDLFLSDISISPQAQSPGRVWLITGPNMAGKSTFLRQNALITILAQIGCYVPATHATLGIVDAIFSRVGSADNLYRDQSTFMMEMLETATILRNATPRSFVIMDEVGRGTTPEDGEAVAFSCLKYLVEVNKCRCLFATHFHGVADMVRSQGMEIGSSSSSLDKKDGAKNAVVEMYCTDVQEDEDGGFAYVHKLRKGVNRRSHALKVAELAGLPEGAIKTAKGILGLDGKDKAQAM